ncbi:hypothetical protein WOLCODRAFT_25251 [Wolfiporia cocos MD-104 SS10]|uniref:FHA domain-containing protein n=1 Tax=Wolfiporia cocos (strain MD-104) TaxID=742152 RepID=A0A2H3JWP0_WOLCO|nr:hypothetical protein WOLCODRAFT_25251 [Wolfiporia cocos MD-104 SS10]
MEEGELAESLHGVARGSYTSDVPQAGAPDTSGAIYSPALEWPGDTETPYPLQVGTDLSCLNSPHDSLSDEPSSSTTLHTRSSNTTSLRLLVLRSSVLPKKQALAVLDGYPEIQIGRDVAPPTSDTPRIRLKEMEVSKLHATVYWDQDRREWAVVDMGSKHGTFLRSISKHANSSPAPNARATLPGSVNLRGVRLSPPREASIPRRLSHLDELSVGGTTFAVHVHEGQVPCADCSPKDGDEIPLYDSRRAEREAAAARKRKRENSEPIVTVDTSIGQRDPKRTLTMLKRSLLSRHDASAVKGDGASHYVDRSARRRALHPDSAPATPYADSHRPHTPYSPPPFRASTQTPPHSLPTPAVSAPPTPVPETNVGHQLLLKQGWQPGTALGQENSSDVALVEPLEVSGNTGRQGLGMTSPAPTALPASQSWQDAAKYKRWSDMKEHIHIGSR